MAIRGIKGKKNAQTVKKNEKKKGKDRRVAGERKGKEIEVKKMSGNEDEEKMSGNEDEEIP